MLEDIRPSEVARLCCWDEGRGARQTAFVRIHGGSGWMLSDEGLAESVDIDQHLHVAASPTSL